MDKKLLARNLKVALELSEMALTLIKERVLREDPQATENKIKKEIAKWRKHQPFSNSPNHSIAPKRLNSIING